MPLDKNIRFRFKKISPIKKIRLAYLDDKVVEVTSYNKKDGKFVKGHTRRMP